MCDSQLPRSVRVLQDKEATSANRMSVGFIGAGQLAHALVKGFTAAGEDTLLCNVCLVLDPKSLMLNHARLFLLKNNLNAATVHVFCSVQ